MVPRRETVKDRNLLISMLLNFIITIIEIIGGVLSGSLSLTSDALHNFGDGVSVASSYAAVRISRKEHTEKMTFGYRRSQILVALFNSIILVGVTIFLFKEAYQRLFSPLIINSSLMISVAFLGLIANTLCVVLLKHDSKDNLNIRSAYLHLFTDALSSLIIIIGGVFIYFFNFYWIDPILTIIIGVYILRESYEIIRKTVNILMEGAPEGIDLHDIKREIEKIDGVENLHHVHIWQTDDRNINFEGHIDVDSDLKISEACEIREKIESILHSFGITHSTIQIEYNVCKDKDIIKN